MNSPTSGSMRPNGFWTSLWIKLWLTQANVESDPAEPRPATRPLPRNGACAPKIISRQATSSRLCSPSASLRRSRCRRSTSTARCAGSTPRLSSISSTCPISPLSAQAPKSSSAHAAAKSPSAPSQVPAHAGKTAIEDAENRASLLADPKERAEHLMLLDLGRNDVGRVTKAAA